MSDTRSVCGGCIRKEQLPSCDTFGPVDGYNASYYNESCSSWEPDPMKVGRGIFAWRWLGRLWVEIWTAPMWPSGSMGLTIMHMIFFPAVVLFVAYLLGGFNANP
jgi:hypothetical protein